MSHDGLAWNGSDHAAVEHTIGKRSERDDRGRFVERQTDPMRKAKCRPNDVFSVAVLNQRTIRRTANNVEIIKNA